MTTFDELKIEKTNVLNLLIEKENIKKELNKYKKMWNTLKQTLDNSMKNGWLLYRKTKNDRWMHCADSDYAVLERINELEGDLFNGR